MHVDRRSWLKYITAGAAAAGVSEKTLAKEAAESKPVALAPETPPLRGSFPKGALPEVGHYDLVRWALYDRLTIPGGTYFSGTGTRHHPDLFVGDSHQYDSLKTNMMMMPGQLPAPQEMLIERIYFVLDPDNGARDSLMFMRRFTWALIFGQKHYAGGIMMESQTKGYLHDVINRSNGLPTGFVPADSLVLPAPYALHLHNQFYFRMPIEAGTFGGWMTDKDFTVYAFLDGVLARGIQ